MYWLPLGVLACAELAFAIALSHWLPAWLSVLVSFFGWLVIVQRFTAQMRDQPRPRWVTRLIDEPLFWHFGANAFTMFAIPVCALGALFSGLVPGARSGGLDLFRSLMAGAYGVGLVLSGWGIWGERRFVRVRRLTAYVSELPREFEGYRIVQLSDLHVGSFDPKARALEWAALSNAQGADLAVVTGDLVTSGRGFYTDVADAIAALRAPDGVFVSMGNHDQAENDELTRIVAERGPVVLRNASHVIRRGTAELVLAGIDGRLAARADVARTLEMRPAGSPVVLLSHYPNTFETAAQSGADLVLSGHTHGGQIGVPFFGDRFNFARLTRQRSRGLARSGKSTLYVNAGLGTTGPPIRLGVPSEIAVITLRRAE